MEKLVKGDGVVLPFPFSDLSASKKRPALVAANLSGDDFILCQITSQARQDESSISVAKTDFEIGKMPVDSMVRHNRLFTADKSIVLYNVGSLKGKKLKDVEDQLVKIFRS